VAWHGLRPYVGVGHPSLDYQPRRPEDDVVYRTVRDHFETFRAQMEVLRDGAGVPRFVEAEFRAFLRCGWLAGWFARFRCTGCGDDRLVAFSCRRLRRGERAWPRRAIGRGGEAPRQSLWTACSPVPAKAGWSFARRRG